VVFSAFGLYKGMWRYTGLIDVLNVLKASIISSSLIVLAILFIYRFEGFSRSIFVIDGFLTFFLVSGVRLSIRIILLEKDLRFFPFNKFSRFRIGDKRGKIRLGIIGGGGAGEKMVREIYDNPRLNYDVVCFLDDDPNKRRMRIHGVPILGPVEMLKDLAEEGVIDEILIAIPSATAQQMRRIVEACEATGLRFRTTPGIGELINGKVSFKMIREVSYEDLLGREQVSIDIRSIGQYLKDKVVVVTGPGGSIGSELCRQITAFHPGNLVLLDKTENNLFHIEVEFKQRFPEVPIAPVLGDVHNRGFLEKLFATHRPHVVFHAAAFKHVPIVELNPWEGVFNNVIGTKNIVEASCQSGVERFVMISTDKAVRPVSVMGATKRVAEMITTCYAEHRNTKLNGGRFVSVRFGNVIGSEGSVIHLFKKQIERYGPVTVTHPEITRYFMTISEACKLILQAGAMGNGGEIFILDMGIPIKIIDMARDLIRRSGFKPDVDIEIKEIGLRPGEKLHEELVTEGEGIVRSDHEKLFILKGENNYDLNWLNQKIEELVELAMRQDAEGIKSKLKEIVPEYTPFDMSKKGFK
jgi:FlaA1/EpsC-like NDP-sugar epimerase